MLSRCVCAPKALPDSTLFFLFVFLFLAGCAAWSGESAGPAAASVAALSAAVAVASGFVSALHESAAADLVEQQAVQLWY